MGFKFVPFNRLKASNQNAIKNVYELSNGKPPPTRLFPITMLIKTTEILANKTDIEEKDKDILLNAMTFYIRDQIEVEYRKGPYHSNPNNSLLYNCLGDTLNLSKDNQPDLSDMHLMYSSLLQFLSEEIYCDIDVIKDLQKCLLDYPTKKQSFFDYENVFKLFRVNLVNDISLLEQLLQNEKILSPRC
jgi:hypothetical protein